MSKYCKNVIKAWVIIVVILTLWPAALAAAPTEPAPLDYPLLEIPRAQGEPFQMASSYEWSAETGPAQCPDPPLFKNGTRVVYSYIPGILNQQVEAVVLWYELDENGNPTTKDPIASGQAVLAANTMPNASLSFGKGAKGIFGAYMFVQDGSEWVLFGTAIFGIAYPGVEAPAPGACPLPETGSRDTGGETAPAPGSAPLNISWSPQMTYESRQGESRWCQMSMTYQNNSGQTYNWPQYRPAFLILNGDGSEDGWYYANYYAKEDGWENGISGTPPPIPSGTSADWTWYSATGWAGQYCAAVAVAYGDWVYVAFYDAQGTLTGAEVYPPE
ncbi:MAG: hypothetical protein JW953_20770 [Anaerolineae bacterium]|nr:hypothetical protein [Anaerolineae bacterium]